MVLSAGADRAQSAHQEVVALFPVSHLCVRQAEVASLQVSVLADQVMVITGQVIARDMVDRVMVTDLVMEGLIIDHITVITTFTGRF